MSHSFPHPVLCLPWQSIQGRQGVGWGHHSDPFPSGTLLCMQLCLPLQRLLEEEGAILALPLSQQLGPVPYSSHPSYTTDPQQHGSYYCQTTTKLKDTSRMHFQLILFVPILLVCFLISNCQFTALQILNLVKILIPFMVTLISLLPKNSKWKQSSQLPFFL